MEIEVGQTSGVFFKAELQEVLKDGIKVEYHNSHLVPEVASFDRCRQLLPDKNTEEKSLGDLLKPRSVVDAYIKQPKSESYGWQKARIRMIKDGFAVVDCIEGPPNSGVVMVERCRPANQTTPLSFDLFQTFSIQVPVELHEFFKDPSACNPLREIITGIKVDFSKETGALLISSFSSYAIRCVELIADVFLSNAKYKKILLDQLEETKKLSKFVETFPVPNDLVGLAIGKLGANIEKARTMDGIVEITLDKSRKDTAGVIIFRVLADTAEAAAKARNLLEFIYGAVPVPKYLVGQVLGKSGSNMQDIVNQSSAIKLQIDGGLNDHERNSDTVDFVFSGRRDSFNHAKLLIQLRVKQVKDLEMLRKQMNVARSHLSNADPISAPNGPLAQTSKQSNEAKKE
uniref:K Homology domain-containing protein n=1 Tax=Ditylenchus dipsaci TaxID=166011 RepID=A0A915DDK9_9BILA